MPALCACGHGYTFSFAEGRVFCRACEGDSIVSKDRAYIRRERKRRADPLCERCGGKGSETYTACNKDGEVEVPCPCVVDNSDPEALAALPDPLADEGQSDARALARER